MKNTAIIIPTRLGAKRFPNKPLAKINDVPMIIHVLNRAKESKVGEVLVATPDDEIFQVVKENGGKAVLTKPDHHSGSDRIYEAYIKELKNNVDLIINLQGDMPNIKPNSISKLEKFMRSNNCDIGTLASSIKDKIKKILQQHPNKKGIILVNAYRDQNLIVSELANSDLYERLTKKSESKNFEKSKEEEEEEIEDTSPPIRAGAPAAMAEMRERVRNLMNL